MKTILLLAMVFLPVPAGAQALAELQQDFNKVAAKAGPAVVSVKVIKEETEAVIEPDYYFGYMLPSEKIYRYQSAGVGSGVIIDKRGYVLTNLHVVEDALKIKIVSQDVKGVEKEWMASVYATDPAIDVALLKIKGGDTFPWLQLNGSSQLKVGDFVLAVGYPFGFKQTFTSGIISALNATLPVEGRKYEKLIQTDAAINRGNSGGPLLNLKGEVIGLNNAIASPTGVFAGMGFAVSASEIRKVLDDLLAGRRIKRGWLGLSLQHLDPVMAARLGIPQEGGAIVNVAEHNSPAYAAGIRRGDIILSCDGDPVDSNEDLLLKTSSRRPGDVMEIAYQRNAEKKTVKVILGERPGEGKKAEQAPAGSAAAAQSGGFEWEGVSFSYDNGALVGGVEEDSGLAGYLRQGDVIKAVNGRAVSKAPDLKKIFGETSLSDGVVFDLVRDGETMYMSVKAR